MNRPKYSSEPTHPNYHKYNAINPPMPKPRVYPDPLKETFAPYHVGQRVFYTGLTTYGRNVTNEPATIEIVSKSIHLLLDDCHKRYQDNIGIDVIPQKQRATLSVGDIKSGAKIIKPIH